MWRGVVAVAAAAVVAAGGATVVSQLGRPHAGQPPPPQTRDVASAMNPSTHVAAVIDYAQTPWNSTDVRVQVSGIAAGTACKFWVIGPHSRVEAGTWTVASRYGASPWYSASAPVKADSVRSFQITTGNNKVLLTVAAPAHAS